MTTTSPSAPDFAALSDDALLARLSAATDIDVAIRRYIVDHRPHLRSRLRCWCCGDTASGTDGLCGDCRGRDAEDLPRTQRL